MDLEGDLSVKIENEVAETWPGKTLDNVVETLFAKVKVSSVK
jgi:hypothetical protein